MTGFINVNKAAGVSSAREVNIIKRLTGTPCGHMGTLDPMASGVLPIAIGNAARLFNYLLDKRKKYIATFRFGVDSDTLDTTGNRVEGGWRVPERAEIESVLPEFLGEIEQVPPNYSAKNIGGRRGYQLARSGVEFTLPPKKVTIYSIVLSGSPRAGEYDFEIECGGGTYIRSIARDLGERLETKAVMSALCRTKSGAFEIERAVRSDKLSVDNVNNFIIPTESLLPYDEFHPSAAEAKRLFNGLPATVSLPDGTYKIFQVDGSFYGLADVNYSSMRIKVKLC